MKKRKLIWITGGIILIALLVFGVLWLSPFSSKTLTEEEMKATALIKYPGEIISATQSDKDYEIEVQMATGVYAIKMDTKNGKILSLKQMSSEELSPSFDKLTEDQIKKEIATQGELKSIHFVDAGFPYYEAVVHNENVEVTLKVDPYDGSIINSTQAPTSTKSLLLTEHEALIIAASHLNGIADEDAELHHPSGQTPYYLVEVEIEDGDDDREAVVQVDAYTGSVKSVKWED